MAASSQGTNWSHCFTIHRVLRLCSQGEKCHPGKRQIHDSRSLRINCTHTGLKWRSSYLQARDETVHKIQPLEEVLPCQRICITTGSVTAGTQFHASVEGLDLSPMQGLKYRKLGHASWPLTWEPKQNT